MTLELRGIPGEPYMSGRCTCCGARLRVSRKPGTAECACGAIFENLTGRLLDMRAALDHGEDMTYDLKGRRLRLVRCTDEYTRLEPGAEGTVAYVDDAGTLHVDWDDGHKLGLVPDEDVWELLS